MSEELNAARKDIQELTIDDGELRMLRHKLSQEKQALQGQLGEINARLKVTMPRNEFHRVNSQRGAIVKQLSEKEREIGELNFRRAEVITVLEVRKHQEFGRNEIKRLVDIRDRWHGFSMDKINHQKAREVAWKISQEIKELFLLYEVFCLPYVAR